MNVFSIENLTSYLDKKNFHIKEIYSINESCSFIHVMCIDTGDDIVISIPFKYPMKVNNAIELIPFKDIDIEERFIGSKDIKESYNEIKINGLEDNNLYLDPEEADKLLEQYQSIDLDSENIDLLKENILSYKKQLDRLKFCTNNIKYKLCIKTHSTFCTITRLNNIECYVVKKEIPKTGEDKNLYIIIDLENFYDKIDNINHDTNRIYKNLYDILGRAHKKQTNIINSRLKQYNNISQLMITKYEKKDRYEKSINKLNEVLKKIKEQEKNIKKQIDNSSKENRLNINKSFKIKNLEDDYEKLLKFKDESIKLLADIKIEYNNFILNFDYYLFDNIRLFNQLTNNFVKLGILSDCKKIN